jgi:hypothetical protein
LELLAVLTHDGGRRRQSNSGLAVLIDEEAFGGNAPDDILCGQSERDIVFVAGH